jgi:protocatechuate 3,4-dioxygenase beta subunit
VEYIFPGTVMDLDDLPIGRVLTRREALTLLGSTGTLLILGCTGSRSGASTRPRATGAGSPCVVRPEMTEGPYYVDEKLNRSDIRSDPSDGTVKEGALLALTFNVSRVANRACTPIEGAIVDVWQCDALGVYSDAVDRNFNTTGKKFLRGHQITDRGGVASFTTVYPGWYPSRTPHIHFKIRSPVTSGSAYEFTSQLFFDEALSDRVYAKPPYAAMGKRTVSNATDGIYKRGGSQLLLHVSQNGDGYAGAFDIALDQG